jgi:uncharacterized protein (TIGR03083 family)
VSNEAEWKYQDYCDALEAEATHFADVVRGVDPATPVPSCPGWTIADLIKHHGSSQRRAAYVVQHSSQEPVLSHDCRADLPDDPAGYAPWFAAGTRPLIATLRAADPDTPVWTNGADQHARYWARRILYEAVVHRADAELALGREPRIQPRVAADGIEEFLTNIQCFPWVAESLRELEADGETLHFHSTDYEGEWIVTLNGGAFSWERGHKRATVAVRGTASDLLLLAYGRFAASRFTVIGDDQLLAQWLSKSAL